MRIIELNCDTIRENIESTIDSILENFSNLEGTLDADTDRNDLIEAMDDACDSLWGDLVKCGRIDQYSCEDLTETASACAEIISYANDNAWVEDDWGLWDGLTYGVLASIAYFSLRNCIYQALADKGYDSNDDYPFAGCNDE